MADVEISRCLVSPSLSFHSYPTPPISHLSSPVQPIIINNKDTMIGHPTKFKKHQTIITQKKSGEDGPISREPDFSSTCGFHRMLKDIMYFHFKPL